MKTLTRLSFAVVAVACAASHALAQTPARTEPEWVAVSPAGEGFEARMPKQPVPVGQHVQANGLSADGLRYSADADERTAFVVWSLKGSSASGPLGNAGHTDPVIPGVAAYLDAVDELAWELLVAPEFERLAREKADQRRLAELEIGMTYGGEFSLSAQPARRYGVSLEKSRGLVYVCAEGAQVYIVAALGADEQEPRLKQFLDSFKLKSASGLPPVTSGVNVRKPGVGDGTGLGVGGNVVGGPVDYSKPFKLTEVTKRAVITAKPEPGFTEQARKFNVTGTVRLRVILAVTGEVRGISIIKGLPHGLTEKSVAAAKQIGFVPAEKDGQRVSQYVTLEYNFNIY